MSAGPVPPAERVPLRTLVVSDLHLGARGDRAVLSDPGCRRALCAAAAGAQRLVLLGDVVELRERPLRDVLPDARPALEELAAALPTGGELVLLAGNHDHRLIAPWLQRRDRGRALGTEAAVRLSAGDPIAELVDRLGAARTRVVYPGVSLRADVWATHGHYSDRHTTVPILERLSAGVMARIVGEGPQGPECAEDYEAALAPVYAWVDALAEHVRHGSERDLEGSERAWLALSGSAGRSVRRRALRVAFPVAIAALNRARIGPLRADVRSRALRRGPLEAMGEVAQRLGVRGGWIVFGHSHRAGPLPGDDPAEWVTGAGARLTNTGCWVRETSFLGPDPARSPFRAGFAVWLNDGDGDGDDAGARAAAPELVNLLD